MNANGCSSSPDYPTPSATSYGSSQNGVNRTRPSGGTPSLDMLTRRISWPTPSTNPDAPNLNSNQVRGNPSLGLLARDWPTPRGEDSESAGNHSKAMDSLTGAVRTWATPRASEYENTTIKMTPSQKRARGAHGQYLAAQAAGWPTPRASTCRETTRRRGTGGRILNEEAKKLDWPTPHGFGYDGHGSELSMAAKVATGHSDSARTKRRLKLWSTPHAGDAKSGGLRRTTERTHAGRSLTSDLIDYFLRCRGIATHGHKCSKTCRRLSPRFVEWLMQFPFGWTNFGPLEMPSYRFRQRGHLSFLLRNYGIFVHTCERFY